MDGSLFFIQAIVSLHLASSYACWMKHDCSVFGLLAIASKQYAGKGLHFLSLAFFLCAIQNQAWVMSVQNVYANSCRDLDVKV